MLVGSPQFEAPMAGFLARELDAVIVSPDYRLAPEHPFPAALDDCTATLQWMISSAGELGIDPARIAVAGASAGGGLAAALAQRCFDDGIPLRTQALLYPMLDDRAALTARGGGLVWSAASNRFAWSAYLGCPPGEPAVPPYAAAARRTELADLPPTWIGVGDRDILCGEALAYTTALREAGVKCELAVIPGMYHAADTLVPSAESMRGFHKSLVEHLRTHLMS
jgi:acetyl esterase/lipase